MEREENRVDESGGKSKNTEGERKLERQTQRASMREEEWRKESESQRDGETIRETKRAR